MRIAIILKFFKENVPDRYTDPYRHYMQSLTCYDLQPTHGAVVVIDGELKVIVTVWTFAFLLLVSD